MYKAAHLFLAPLLVLTLAASKSTDLDTDPHLAGWWKLDETSGKAAADATTHHRNGALQGGLTFDASSAKGRIGKALHLDGDGKKFLQISNYKGITGTHARTVAAWIKTTRPRGEIISWGEQDGGKMFIFGFIRQGVGVTPRGGYLYTLAKVHDNKWHHMAAVVRKAELPNLYDDVTLYKDGEVAEIDDIGLLDLWPINTGSDLDVRIGRGFKGEIDDVRVYDRPLSEDEIKAIYKAAEKSR